MTPTKAALDGNGITKKIPLTRGKFALVDDEDYESLMQWKWHDSAGYAARSVYLGGGRKNRRSKKIFMHVEINKTPPGMQTDHIDGDTLNNQKSNLRAATHGENARNSGAQNGKKSSRYKGVRLQKLRGYKLFTSRIAVDYKRIFLGSFPPTDEGEKAAAIAYNRAALKLHGKFAKLNEVEI